MSLRRRISASLGQRDLVLLALAQFAISIYGGYFGGGMGIMMLAACVGGMTDIHGMNGLKAVLGAVINGVALIEFIASGSVAWSPGLVMAAGGIIGGYTRSVDRKARRTRPHSEICDRHCMGDDDLFLSPIASRRGGPSLRLSLHPPVSASSLSLQAHLAQHSSSSDNRHMKAMVLTRAGAGSLDERAHAEPIARAGELLVRVRACGVCRTDLHLVDGELPPFFFLWCRDTKSSALWRRSATK